MRNPTARRGLAVSLSSSQRRTRNSSRFSSGELGKLVSPSNGSTSRQLRPPRSIIDSEKPSERCSAVNSLIAVVASCSRLDNAPARHTLAPSVAAEDRTLSTAAEGSKASSAPPGTVIHRLPTQALREIGQLSGSNAGRASRMILPDERQHIRDIGSRTGLQICSGREFSTGDQRPRAIPILFPALTV